MGKSAEDLRQDIESTRADMGETLDAIGDRVSPGRMIERRRFRMRRGMERVRNMVMGTAVDVRERVSGVADTGTEKVSSAVGSMGDAPDALRDRTQGNPLVVGLIAFGGGVLAASILPVSRAEERAGAQLAGSAQPLKDQLSSAGREVVDHMKEPVRQAAEDVKETAREGAQEVRESAREHVEEVKESAKEGADDVKETARQAAQTATSGQTPGQRSAQAAPETLPPRSPAPPA